MSAVRSKLAKMLLVFMLIMTGAIATNLTVASQPTYAACPNGNFLNFRPWWHGLRNNTTCELVTPVTRIDSDGNVSVGTGGSGGYTITTFAWRIVFNSMDILFGIVAYAAVFFVVLGGFNVLFSGGDPGKVSKGKMTIMNALLGVAVALLASGLVRFVNDTLIGTGNHNLRIENSTGTFRVVDGYDVNTDDVWLGAMGAFLMVAGIGAVMMVVWGGVKLSMASGDPAATAKAKNTILFALIGAIVMLLASFIVGFVADSVGG